ncbi:MAG: 50S ribosome-binding GTPase, partial [Muribaculaceae bacterium]|nr:50S ribosome-binding GTPase [Muribaculaceae bacterium]
TNRTPRYAQPGEPAIEKSIVLELKLLADVGLVGFPNAGKSTLLSAVSAARPKIADYPFTTMEPQLGIVAYRDNRSFVMADIPGIIEGASQGKGLGLRFLRHIERNAVLLFMVPADSNDIAADYKVLSDELAQFNPDLVDKPRVLAVSKSDMLDDELKAEIEKTLPKGVPHIFISAVTGYNLDKLKDMLWEEITAESNRIDSGKIIHRPLDVKHRVQEEDEFIFEAEPMPEDDEEFFDDEEGYDEGYDEDGDYYGGEDMSDIDPEKD